MREILIVDDTAENLRLLKSILNDANYRIRAATNGEMALKSAKLSPPSLILMDINMPGMDGKELCKEVRSNQATQSIKIIMITASIMAQEKKELSQYCDQILLKPISKKQIIELLQIYLPHYEQHHVEEHNEETEEPCGLNSNNKLQALTAEQRKQSQRLAEIGNINEIELFCGEVEVDNRLESKWVVFCVE